MHGIWREHFSLNDMDQYFEYVLGDLEYIDIEMFIMLRIQGHEMDEGISQGVVDASKKMHASYLIQVEWSIGGLK